jgi:hypothetical protein
VRCSLEQRLQRFRQELGLDLADGIADIRRAAMCNAIKGDYSVAGPRLSHKNLARFLRLQ